MKILSFDVGIKNLAVCLLDTDYNSSNNDKTTKLKHKDYTSKNSNNTNVTILDWRLLDLSPTIVHKCSNIKKNKTKDVCGLTATYKDSKNNCYCKRHAKSSDFLIPDPKLNSNQLKRNSIKKLNEILELYDIKITGTSKTKDAIIAAIESYKNKNFLKLIEKESSKANKDSLIDLCRIMTQNLDALYSGDPNLNAYLYHNIDMVLIENQIGKIAVRMKSIQGMLTQYFVGRGIKHIEYVSSMNKLKKFCDKKNLNYKERKAESIVITHKQIELYNPNWLVFFNNFSKKDDLADCFLQALWKVSD